MKGLLLGLLFSVIACPVWAACPQIPLNVKDASNNTVPMSSASAADGNCKTYIDADTASQLHQDITAPIATGANVIGKTTTDLTTPGTTNAVALGCAGATIANTKTKPFSNGASASNLLLVTGVGSTQIYICAINVGPAASAVNVTPVEGTTVTNPCDTGTTGIIGGNTAATGWQFAANGGIAYGNGSSIVAQTATLADNVCLLFSGAVQVSGVITYVQR